MKILVTGIAGDIGNGIGRILKGCDFVERLIGCHIHGEYLGRYIFDDACENVPRALASGDLERWRLLKVKLDAIVVTSGPELRILPTLLPPVGHSPSWVHPLSLLVCRGQ